MKKIGLVMLIGIVCCFVVPARAQLGNMLKSASGLGGGSSASGLTPIAYVSLATVEFLQSSKSLSEAAANAEQAKKCSDLINLIKGPDGMTKENLGKIDEIEAENAKILADKAKTGKLDKKKMTDATIHAGVAAFLEGKGIDSAKSAGVKNLSNPGEALLFASIAPANLKSMVVLNEQLMAYAEAHGIDGSSITSSVDQRVAELEKK